MNKSIISLLFILFICQYSYAQYTKTITVGSLWNVSYKLFGAANYVETLDFDTLINNKIYTKFAIPASYGNTCFVREDTVSKKIYRLESSFSESVLYDFSLTVGDTFSGAYQGYQFVLDSITNSISYDVCGQSIPPALYINNPKVFYFKVLPYNQFNGHIVWVEGIGSLMSFLQNDTPWNESGCRVLCHYDHNNFRDFHNSSCETDTCLGPIYGNTSNILVEHDIHLYPNPSESLIHIELKNLKFNLNKVVLYDVLGLVSSTNLFDRKTNTLNISTLNKGVYLAVFQFENKKKITKKIIKN